MLHTHLQIILISLIEIFIISTVAHNIRKYIKTIITKTYIYSKINDNKKKGNRTFRD